MCQGQRDPSPRILLLAWHELAEPDGHCPGAPLLWAQGCLALPAPAQARANSPACRRWQTAADLPGEFSHAALAPGHSEGSRAPYLSGGERMIFIPAI